MGESISGGGASGGGTDLGDSISAEETIAGGKALVLRDGETETALTLLASNALVGGSLLSWGHDVEEVEQLNLPRIYLFSTGVFIETPSTTPDQTHRVRVEDGGVTITSGNSTNFIMVDDEQIFIGAKLLSNGDIEFNDDANGVILKSPDNSRWRLTVDNTRALVTTEI